MYWKVDDIAAIMEQLFPGQLAESWDNPGLQVGSPDTEVRKAIIALDLDEEVAAAAASQQAALIITHHPLIFQPLSSINIESVPGSVIAALIRNQISAFCAHTNLDAAPGGLNDWLAEALGLEEIGALPGTSRQRLFKLVVYVPRGHEEAVREAMSRAGAGHTGRYSDCSFRAQGIGTFRPEAGSQPFIGEAGRLEEVEEYRLETVVESRDLPAALAAIRTSHPYEEPAFDIIALENPVSRGGIGRIGRLPAPIKLKDFCGLVRNALKVEVLKVAGSMERTVHRVAVVGGSGASFAANAVAGGADVLVTGDVKYHEARDACEAGIALVDAGHYGTEIIMAAGLAGLLNQLSRQHGKETLFIPFANRNCFTEVF